MPIYASSPGKIKKYTTLKSATRRFSSRDAQNEIGNYKFSTIFDVFLQNKFFRFPNNEGNVPIKTNKIESPNLNVWAFLPYELHNSLARKLRKITF